MKKEDFVFALGVVSWLAAGSTSSLMAESAKPPVIVLDPGHSGKDISGLDKQTRLLDHDYPNHPEMEECFRVAKAVEARLLLKGYKVVCTKATAMDSVSLRERANIAKQARAVIGVSIHDDHGQRFASFAQVYAQHVGLWRGGTVQRPRVVFTNGSIAATSIKYAAVFAAERTRAEGHQVDQAEISFGGRRGIEPGTIPEVSLFAGSAGPPVPWVYNEVGGIGFGPEQEAKYVEGLVAAIERCIPILSRSQR